ncbi:HGGxSTG domain-containing protein [Allochromatium vinosum]|uniref:HGGxSTG domain-containing protein n=1 Tax=Allochromatium vinosum TaxID=1049 RepID=UPI0009D78F81
MTTDREICGARTRAGGRCKRRDLYASGRCALHGGKSTGPRTPEGKDAARENLKKARAALASPEHYATRSRRSAKANRRRPLAWLDRRISDDDFERDPSRSP